MRFGYQTDRFTIQVVTMDQDAIGRQDAQGMEIWDWIKLRGIPVQRENAHRLEKPSEFPGACPQELNFFLCFRYMGCQEQISLSCQFRQTTIQVS